jgi:hypothetical protein
MTAPSSTPDQTPCPDNARPHPDRYHDERIRSIGGAPCSTCALCAAAAETTPSTPLLCDPSFEELTGQAAECEDGCSLDLDHKGVCATREFHTEKCSACGNVDRLHLVATSQLLDGDEPYYQSRAKEDARNAAFTAELGDSPGCGSCGDPVCHGSGAAVTCAVCGPFCCEDHHRRHPRYAAHDLGGGSSAADAQASLVAAALDIVADALRAFSPDARDLVIDALLEAAGRDIAGDDGEPAGSDA